jgi:hypothetical protein
MYSCTVYLRLGGDAGTTGRRRWSSCTAGPLDGVGGRTKLVARRRKAEQRRRDLDLGLSSSSATVTGGGRPMTVVWTGAPVGDSGSLLSPHRNGTGARCGSAERGCATG